MYYIVLDMPSLDVVGSSTLKEFSRKHHSHLPPWEMKLVAAQSCLFNQELFTMVSGFATCDKIAPFDV